MKHPPEEQIESMVDDMQDDEDEYNFDLPRWSEYDWADEDDLYPGDFR